jgi:uncharacterized protein (TIGR03382 family)
MACTVEKVSTVERTLVAFTITVSAIAPAHASHPPQPLQTANRARTGDFVAPPVTKSGLTFARQVVPPAPPSPPFGGGAASSSVSARAQSRTIFLNRDGAVLLPGDNDARLSTSSIVREPTLLTPWEIDDDTWSETVACVKDLYARFDVTITDEDPGDVPHLEAVFGGHPFDVGLPDNVAGVSPFTTDCSVIENSVVFTFTDVLPDDAQLMCEVMGQEIAHSFGLDHQMLASDPMTYLDYDGKRTFKDQLSACGEFEDRPCGIAGSVCRNKQNSVQLLESRLGRRGTGAPDDPAGTPITTTSEPEAGGCSASGSAGAFPVVAIAAALRRRRRRPR